MNESLDSNLVQAVGFPGLDRNSKKGAFGIIDGKTNAPGGRGFIPRNRLKFCMAARIMCNLPLTLLMPPKNILNHDLKHPSLILLAKRDVGKGGHINVIVFE